MERRVHNGSVRLLLLLIFVLASAGAIFQDMRFDSAIARERATAADLERDFAALDVTLADFRAAQAGYVAIGQGAAFWMTRAADLVAQLDETMTRLKNASASADAQLHYATAATALGELNKADQRARQDATNDQRYLASDVIFVDALTIARRLATELDAAEDAERRTAEAHVARIGRVRAAMNAGALALGLIIAIVLSAGRGTRETTTQMLAALRQQPATPAVEKPIASAVPSPIPAPAPAGPTINLSDVAELCVDLGRLTTNREMPAMLERTARVLGAKGVIVWMIDTSGAFLRPLVAHGYSDKVMQRLGRLQVDGDNVTSLAFRSTQPQTVNAASTDASGAIAVPLVAASRCIGVLSAEINRSRPDRDTVSAARMIAAQLAALAVPAEAPSTAPQAARG